MIQVIQVTLYPTSTGNGLARGPIQGLFRLYVNCLLYYTFANDEYSGMTCMLS